MFDFLCLKNVPSMSLQQQNLIFIGKSYSSMHICLCALSSVSRQYKRFSIVVLVNRCKCLLCVTCKTSVQFSSFGYVPSIKIRGLGGSSLLGFSSKTVQFPCVCINSHSHHLCTKGFPFKKKSCVCARHVRRCVYHGTHVEVRGWLPGVAVWVTAETEHSLSSGERQKGASPHRAISPALRVSFLCSPPCIGCSFPYRAILTAARLHLGPLFRISLLRCAVVCVCICSLSVHPLLKNVDSSVGLFKNRNIWIFVVKLFQSLICPESCALQMNRLEDFLP